MGFENRTEDVERSFATFMISKPNLQCNDWSEFKILNGVIGS